MTNATTIRTHTVTTTAYLAELPNGVIVDLPMEADEMIDPALTDDGTTLRYGVHYDSWGYDFPDGVEFVQGNPRNVNYNDDPDEWIESMQDDHDLFPVDVYEHGQIMYSLSGGGPQCDFDTARGGACIAIPNERHESPFTDTRGAAADILAEYTAWCNGETYGIVELTLNSATGEVTDEDSVYGFYGWKQAEEACKAGA